jgi:hypothetical protein
VVLSFDPSLLGMMVAVYFERLDHRISIGQLLDFHPMIWDTKKVGNRAR